MKIGLTLIFAILMLSLTTIAAQESGDFVALPCPFELPDDEVEGDSIDCGVITVPESRTGLSDATIDLAVVILYATDEETLAPMIYLAGGPGNSATDIVEEYYDDPLRDYLSIIFLDQRGTGYSSPSLDCPEFDEEGETDEATLDCYNRLVASGITLDAYRTSENAADVNDVISALDLDSVTLYGISYGTRLALAVMKDPHPAIEAVILDGVYPPDVHGYEDDAPNIARVFDLIIESCADDAACDDAYPDLRNALYEGYDSLNSDPIATTDEDDEEDEITGDSFMEALFQSFYDTDSIPDAPYLIYAAYNRDEEALEEFYSGDDSEAMITPRLLALQEEPENDGNSEGMFDNFECADEIPFNRIDAITAAIKGLDMPAGWQEDAVESGQEILELCEAWVVTPSDPAERAATVSDIPTLIVNGEYDPVTPPAWAEHAAETLANSSLFIIPAGGHGVIDMSDCTIDIEFQFLNDPTTEPDGSCVDEMPPPDWYIE